MKFLCLFISLVLLAGTLRADQICPIEPGNPDFEATVEAILQNPSLYNAVDADEFNEFSPEERAQKLQEIRTKLSETGELRIFATQEQGGAFGMTVTRIEGLQFGAPQINASQCPTLTQIKGEPPPQEPPPPETPPSPRGAEDASAAPRGDLEAESPLPSQGSEPAPAPEINLGQTFDNTQRSGQEGMRLAQLPGNLPPPQAELLARRGTSEDMSVLDSLNSSLLPDRLYLTQKPTLYLQESQPQGLPYPLSRLTAAEACLRATSAITFAVVAQDFVIKLDQVVNCVNWVFGQSP